MACVPCIRQQRSYLIGSSSRHRDRGNDDDSHRNWLPSFYSCSARGTRCGQVVISFQFLQGDGDGVQCSKVLDTVLLLSSILLTLSSSSTVSSSEERERGSLSKWSGSQILVDVSNTPRHVSYSDRRCQVWWDVIVSILAAAVTWCPMNVVDIVMQSQHMAITWINMLMWFYYCCEAFVVVEVLCMGRITSTFNNTMHD